MSFGDFHFPRRMGLYTTTGVPRSSGQVVAILIVLPFVIDHVAIVSECDRWYLNVVFMILLMDMALDIHVFLYLWIGQHRALVSPLKAYIGRRWQPTSLHACAPLGAPAVPPSLLLHRRHAGEAQGQNIG